jgi:hypothetical protein
MEIQELQEKGYEFGKKLNTLNADPSYYAYKIMSWLVDFSDEEEKAVYAGCDRAISEVSEDVLDANLREQVKAMVAATEQQMASPWSAHEGDSFESGENSVLIALPSIKYGPSDPYGYDKLFPKEQAEADAAFKNGVDMGQQIKDFWFEIFGDYKKIDRSQWVK